jgi:hypothetical protein
LPTTAYRWTNWPPPEERIDDIIRTDGHWRDRRSAGFPRGSPPAQNIHRKTVRANVFLIEELRGDQDAIARGRTGLFRGFLERARLMRGWGLDQSNKTAKGLLAAPRAGERDRGQAPAHRAGNDYPREPHHARL